MAGTAATFITSTSNASPAPSTCFQGLSGLERYRAHPPPLDMECPFSIFDALILTLCFPDPVTPEKIQYQTLCLTRVASFRYAHKLLYANAKIPEEYIDWNTFELPWMRRIRGCPCFGENLESKSRLQEHLVSEGHEVRACLVQGSFLLLTRGSRRYSPSLLKLKRTWTATSSTLGSSASNPPRNPSPRKKREDETLETELNQSLDAIHIGEAPSSESEMAALAW